MASKTQASQDKQLVNTEHHLEEAMQKLEMSRDSPFMSREDYEKMSHEDLASLATCQDLSSRLEINSLKAMLEQETMKKESLANLLEQERSSRTLLEQQIEQAAQDANEMQQELGSLKAELIEMKRRKRARKLRKEHYDKQTHKLERQSETMEDDGVGQNEAPTVAASGSQSTDQMSLEVYQPAQKLSKEERRARKDTAEVRFLRERLGDDVEQPADADDRELSKAMRAQLARRITAQVFENFRVQFQEFLRAEIPALLDSFHTMVDVISTIPYEIDDEGYSEFD